MFDTDSPPTFLTTIVAETDCPTVLAAGSIRIEARSGALLRSRAFGVATCASSGPSFPDAFEIPPTGIARRTVEESAGAAATVTETKSRAPVAWSGWLRAALCQ